MAEDSDNALLPKIGGGGIPAPVLVNPLAAMNQGLATAGHLWDVEGARAKQAAGQAFLNSIDPATGQPDQAKLLRNLRNNPATALAAQTSAQSGVTLDTNTQDLKMKRLTGINAAAMALTAQYPNGVPQSAVNDELDRLGPTFGLTPEQIAEAKRSFGADPAANSRTLIRNSISNLNAQDALHATMPQRQPLNLGGEVVHPDVNPVTNPGGPGSVRTSASPADQAGLVDVDVPVDKDGNYTNDPSKVVRYDRKKIPRQYLPGQPLPGGPGTQPATGGIAPPAPPTTPLPTGYQPRPVVAPVPGATPVPNAPAPVVPAPAPGGATPAPTSPQTPVVPGVTTGPGGVPMVAGAPPQGQPDLLAKDNEVRTQARLAMGDQQKRLIAGNSALEALKLADTGPSTGFFARAYAFLKAQGITTVPQGQMSDTDYRQILQKNLLRFAQTGAKTSGTDLGLETQLHSNANVDEMLAAANRHVLIQDIGILRRDIAQTQEIPDSAPAGAVVKHLGDFPANTDPVAFQWDHMSPAERQEHLDKIKNVEGGMEKWERSMRIARSRGAWGIPTQQATPAPTAAPPPTPAVRPNALVPTN